jgi:ABC-type nitrate/sulfonate/bicarbonate transport system substrate-binding protein
MGTFVIHAHGRLQEWVAEEKGYFAAEGLTDYVLKQNDLRDREADASVFTDRGKEYGAYESYEKGRDASVSCACHWTVNMAASADHGTLWGGCYSVTPGAIMVPPESEIRTPKDLANVEVWVGYHSGSHYATIQALETYLSPDEIALHFGGLPDERVDAAIAREAKAVNVFGMQLYVLEQLGFRKIMDTTFMIAGLIADGVDRSDVEKFYAALRRAQADIDLNHQRFAHYYKNELPERFAGLVDVGRFGPGERLVFEPYSKETYESTHDWVVERGIFDLEKVGNGAYEDAVALVT